MLAAKHVSFLTDEGSPEHLRAHLYHAAARVVTPDHSLATAELEKIDKTKLSERDVELQTAALAVGLNVRKALPDGTKSVSDAGPKTVMRPKIDFARSTSVVDHAQKLLDQSQEQLKETIR